MTAATPFRKARRLGLAWVMAAASLLGASTLQAQEAAPPLVYPHTEYSDRIQALAKEFNAVSPAPIIIIDRDLLALNLSLRQIDDFDPPARAKLLAELAKAETGKDFETRRLQEASYEMTTGRAETWSPGYGPSADMPGTGFCTVYAEDPDHDGPTQLRDLMNLNGIYDAFGARPLINPLPLSIINAYTDYHELGHCLYYVPPFPDGAPRDVVNFQRHKGEVFGDVFASLMLARDGVTDFAPRYARVRLVASAMAGVDDDYLHATWDGLEAAQREIDARGASAFKNMPVQDIIALAKRVMEENVIDIPTMRVAAAFQHSDYDEAALKAQAGQDPSLQKAASYALKLKDRMAVALTASVDLKGMAPENLSPLDLVKYYRTHQQEEADEAKGPTYQEITARLRAELLASAGPRPDAASLSKAFGAKEDALRHMLESRDAATRQQAAQELPLMERALKQAVAAMRLPKPGA